jgi:hypothetical protein
VPRAPSDTNTSLLGILLWTNPFESLSELWRRQSKETMGTRSLCMLTSTDEMVSWFAATGYSTVIHQRNQHASQAWCYSRNGWRTDFRRKNGILNFLHRLLS